MLLCAPVGGIEGSGARCPRRRSEQGSCLGSARRIPARPWLPAPIAASWSATRGPGTRTSIYALVDKSPSIRRAGNLSVEEIATCFRACGGDLDAMVARIEVSKRALIRRLKELGLVQDA
jgi:two-component system nitrogen regulation response regulator GlnG